MQPRFSIAGVGTKCRELPGRVTSIRHYKCLLVRGHHLSYSSKSEVPPRVVALKIASCQNGPRDPVDAPILVTCLGGDSSATAPDADDHSCKGSIKDQAILFPGFS